MKDLTEIRDFLQNGYLNYLPHISIDCTIFGYNDRQLKLLVGYNKIIGEWWLPGGHIKKTETLEEAANRIVMERTGIDNLFLQQFKTFSDPERAQLKGVNEKKWLRSLTLHGIEITKDNWLRNQRTISVGFYAITDFSRAIPQSDNMFVDCVWFDIANVPNLQFDHNEMVKEALHTMRVQLYYYPIGYNMLPEKFTLADIHALYETLLGKKLDISNFPKKLIALGLLKKLNETRSIGAHRSPHLYSFDKEKYDKALKEGLVLN